MKSCIYTAIITLLLMSGCSPKKYRVNFKVQNCETFGGGMQVFGNVRLFKSASGGITSVNKEDFVTYLNQGDNPILLEEGLYYVACTRIFNPGEQWNNFSQEGIKDFIIDGTFLEFDLCKKYNSYDWRMD